MQNVYVTFSASNCSPVGTTPRAAAAPARLERAAPAAGAGEQEHRLQQCPQ